MPVLRNSLSGASLGVLGALFLAGPAFAQAATELVPALGKASYNGARVGLRPATPDELPIIGRSKKLPGLVYATGHFRNGILLAPLTARVVADLILENREDEVLETTSPQRFGEY